MKKTILNSLVISVGLLGGSINAQNIGINGTGALPDASAMLDVSSTTTGFLPPRLTTVQRDAIASPVEGLMVYNTSEKCLQFYNGTNWSGCLVGYSFPPGTVFCGNETVVKDVLSATGKTWMDRNLGASRVATVSNDGGNNNLDASAYGDLYQWGRKADGHQCRNSPFIGDNADIPVDNKFITEPNIPLILLLNQRFRQNIPFQKGRPAALIKVFTL